MPRNVTAVDSDPALIRALDERARRQGAALETAVADARTFSLRRRGFALAIAAMQVTQLMGGRDGRRAMLSRVREHLVPGGVLAAALADPFEGVPADDAPRPTLRRRVQ